MRLWFSFLDERPLYRKLNEDETALCREFLEQMHSRDIFLPFFTAFAEIDPVCRAMSGQLLLPGTMSI